MSSTVESPVQALAQSTGQSTGQSTSQSTSQSPVADLSVLSGKTIAFLVASGFAETEFAGLQRALAKVGARAVTIAPETGLVNGWNETTKTTDDGKTITMGDWGHYHPVDRQLGETLAADLDGVIVPGGTRSLAKLAANLHVGRIVKHAIDSEKPVLLFGEAAALAAAGKPQSVLVLTDLAGTDASSAEGTSWVEQAMQHLARTVALYDSHDLKAAA